MKLQSTSPSLRLSTERLIGTPLGPEDYDEIRSLHRDPNVMATLGGVHNDLRAEQWLRDNQLHWERYGFGIWVFRDREDQSFIGRAGLRHVQFEGEDKVEIAYAITPEYWGRGFTTEIARELVSSAHMNFGIAKLIGYTLTNNFGSRRVLEKSGFAYEHDFSHRAGPHALYRMDITGAKDAPGSCAD